MLLSLCLACAGGFASAGPAKQPPPPPTAAPAVPTPQPAEERKPFGFEVVEQRARELATQPYVRDDGGVPESLERLDYDQYRDIRFKVDRALWRDEGLPFQVQLFHRGFMFKDRVMVNVVNNGEATRLAYSSELFDFGNNPPPGPLDAALGFAGVRFHYPLRRNEVFDEVSVFLGASYFRAVGLGQTYGLSARGLAVDTGLTKAEEFPIFREFWIEKPTAGASELVVYALMDSPSITGAYRFVVRPGLDTAMDVSHHLYFRRKVERLGIAPLTSMFFHGENTDRFADDFRPEVHDSDGLLISRSNGEWIWRPLNNPRHLRISVFRDERLTGFGVLQRDRHFDHYQDLEANYHRRPTSWVEAVGDWGPGAVYLIEIPSDAEKYDNIVAFWVPDQPTDAGKEMNFSYRLHLTSDELMAPRSGKVQATRIGAGGTNAQDAGRRKFVVDFASETLKLYGEDAKIEADVGTSSGAIRDAVVHKNTETGAWRLSFELEPEKDKDPVELRAVLRAGKDVLTETWLYQWSAQ
ncbi:MAG: glucan biosynthesis protein G [Methylococcus sp.]|nr:glucan biosynthesis protein G [Methylococcus sp.]